jgi:hypothetical protein
MGLDLFAHGVDPQAFQDLPNVLCGSMFTDGQSSIRGKVYAGFISDICDVDIYQEKLPTKDLQRIVTQLSVYYAGAADPTNTNAVYTLHKSWGFSLKEVKGLLDWFTVIKENNGQVIGWW